MAVEQTNPMQGLVDETEAVASSGGEEEPILKPSNKPGFDDTAVQDAKSDHDVEGGLVRPKTTGPMKFSGDAASEGFQITKAPLSDSAKNMYELSGFHVEIQGLSGITTAQINQDFKDLETAKMSINGDRYLMPVKTGGFKACKITRGAPIICFEERQILEYVDEKWRR